jgi:hypothetical protein
MIKVALKHYIYDYCIDLIFKGISSNFIGFSYNKNLKVGDRYSLIVERSGITGVEWYHYDCAKSFHTNYRKI